MSFALARHSRELDNSRANLGASHAASHAEAMVRYLRSAVLARPVHVERFHAIFVDSRRTYLGDAAMGRGGSSSLSIRMRELFQTALSVGASGLIVAHNHPSGDCRPSPGDISATLRLREIAGALDIELIDHFIVTETAVYSMRAGGYL